MELIKVKFNEFHPSLMTINPVYQTERPRNVNAIQAAAILYGDWGTSKAYVVGLAFAIAAHSSFWLILGVSLLNILVGLNYMLICKYYPYGGGVYASVRKRSEILALLGGMFLICDYIITASLSALSAFSYLGVEYPQIWAISAIGGIGILNYLGPRHTGNLASIIGAFAFVIVILLGILSIPHLPDAIAHTKFPEGSFRSTWVDFVSIVVALSGIEAIANMTGVMKINKNSTLADPVVTHTSTPAIFAIMMEVSIFTALFSLAVNALPGLTFENGSVFSLNHADIRDYMLKYMGETFCDAYFIPGFCYFFGLIISLAFGILLLSAINTAILALNSLLFVMAQDGQLPQIFCKINSYGVPIAPLYISALAPILVLVFVHDLETMAHLYAIGFVGAIATNLGSTSTNFKLDLKLYERILMFSTFFIMLSIEVTLFIEKPSARLFVLSVIAIGLILRALVIEQQEKKIPFRIANIKGASKKALMPIDPQTLINSLQSRTAEQSYSPQELDHLHTGDSVLCAVSHVGKTIEFAINESKNNKQKLYILFIREQMVLKEQGTSQLWLEDPQACQLFDYLINNLEEPNFVFLYDVSDLPHVNILEHAKQLKVSRLILGFPRTSRLLQIIRGDVVSEVYRHLPPEIDLVIVS